MTREMAESERVERRENWVITGSVLAAALVVSWMILFVSLSAPKIDPVSDPGGHSLRFATAFLRS